jgi:hypothetical protein
MHSPTNRYLNLVKQIFRYIKGTLHHEHTSRSSTSDLIIYSEADWVGCLDTRRSTSSYCAYFGGNLVSWSSKWQYIVSRFNAEVEYCGIANIVAELLASSNSY